MDTTTHTIADVRASRHLRSIIAARALVDERAVERAYTTRGVRPLTHRAITEAATAIGAAPPPPVKPIRRGRTPR